MREVRFRDKYYLCPHARDNNYSGLRFTVYPADSEESQGVEHLLRNTSILQNA
jgi:hypothetical protein